ncbi:MAG: hypothetical protein OEY86_07140 [Nitrospira sp.]|nr:hypothetical protein [Nitrospira sp.]
MESKQNNQPCVMLQGRILLRDQHGVVRDVTHANIFGLTYLAEIGGTALHILEQCKKRLALLGLAAENREHVDANLVRLTVEDVQSDLEEGTELASYVGLMQEMFANATALPQHEGMVTDAYHIQRNEQFRPDC